MCNPTFCSHHRLQRSSPSSFFHFSWLLCLCTLPFLSPFLYLRFALSLPFLLSHQPVSTCPVEFLWGSHSHIHSTKFQPYRSDVWRESEGIGSIGWTSGLWLPEGTRGRTCCRGKGLPCKEGANRGYVLFSKILIGTKMISKLQDLNFQSLEYRIRPNLLTQDRKPYLVPFLRQKVNTHHHYSAVLDIQIAGMLSTFWSMYTFTCFFTYLDF